LFREKYEKKQLELSQAEEALTGPEDEEGAKRAKLDELIEEAQEQTTIKHNLEVELKGANEPQKGLLRQVQRLGKDQKEASQSLQNANGRLEEKRQQILEKAGSAESEASRRAAKLKAAEEEFAAAREKNDQLKQDVNDSFRAYEELEPYVDQAKQNVSAAGAKVEAVKHRIRDLESSAGGSLAMFGQRCQKVKQLVSPTGDFVQISNVRVVQTFLTILSHLSYLGGPS
jgi:chromosome segregation ATPase